MYNSNDFSNFLVGKNDWIQSNYVRKSHGKLLKFNHFSNIKTHIICTIPTILVIFLSVRMIEFNHLSYEKVNVNFKKNFAGS